MDINQKLNENIKEELSLLKKETREVLENFKFKDIFIEIGRNNKLSTSEIRDLETETILTLIGLTSSEQLKQNIENNIGTSEIEAAKIEREVVEKILKPITLSVVEKIKNSHSNNNNDDIPLPPYAKKAEGSAHSEPLPPQGLPVMDGGVKTEEELFEKTGIKMMDENKKESLEENKFTNSEDKILFDSGIKTIEEGHTVDKGNSLSNVNMESISNQINIPIPPEARTNMINQRLNENVVNTQSAVTHSSDLLAKDPYHETID